MYLLLSWAAAFAAFVLVIEYAVERWRVGDGKKKTQKQTKNMIQAAHPPPPQKEQPNPQLECDSPQGTITWKVINFPEFPNTNRF